MVPRRLDDAGSPAMTTTTTIAVPMSCAGLCTKLVELTQRIDDQLAQAAGGAAFGYGALEQRVADGWLPHTARAMAHLLAQGTSREAEATGGKRARLPYSRSSFECVGHEVGTLYRRAQPRIEEALIHGRQDGCSDGADRERQRARGAA
jgi:hypothetical protein